jgi:hypothetical protein
MTTATVSPASCAGVFVSGVEKHSRSKIHAEALHELSQSFRILAGCRCRHME